MESMKHSIRYPSLFFKDLNYYFSSSYCLFFRAKCIEKLNDIVDEYAGYAASKLDYCIILDSIVDVSCRVLDISISLPSQSGFEKLMSVITHRCPKLDKLYICAEYYRGMVLSNTSAISNSHIALNHLTLLHFTNQYLAENHHLESLSTIVGATCPNLTDLRLDNFDNNGNKKLILFLLIKKELVDALFSGKGNKVYRQQDHHHLAY